MKNAGFEVSKEDLDKILAMLKLDKSKNEKQSTNDYHWYRITFFPREGKSCGLLLHANFFK